MNNQLKNFKSQFTEFFDKLSEQIITFEKEKKENQDRLNEIQDQLEEIENFKKVSVVSSLNKTISQQLNEINVLKKQLEQSEIRNGKLQDTITDLKRQLKKNNETGSASSLSYDSDKSEITDIVSEVNSPVQNVEIDNISVENTEVQNIEVENTEVQNMEVENTEVQNTEEEDAEVENGSEGEEEITVEFTGEEKVVKKITYKEILIDNKKYYLTEDNGNIFKRLKEGKVGKKVIGNINNDEIFHM